MEEHEEEEIDDEELDDDELEKELDDLQNIFNTPFTQRDKVEFIIMMGEQIPEIRRTIEMKLKRKYKQ